MKTELVVRSLRSGVTGMMEKIAKALACAGEMVMTGIVIALLTVLMAVDLAVELICVQEKGGMR